MEFHLIRRLFEDKSIMNPINPEEVFSCKDLVDVCRKERRFQTQKNSKLRRCFEYRKLAFKCYYMQEEDFVDELIERYEERKKLVSFLEQEGSILTAAFKDKSSVFRVRNITGQEMD